MIPVFTNLQNLGSKAMNVNGSLTPRVFTFSPNVRSAITGLNCILKDEGSTSPDKFGALSALSNGLLIQATVGGVTTDITVIKDNSELCTRFHFNHFGNGAILSLLGIATPEGFGNSNNLFVGQMQFLHPNFILLEVGDSISVTVRDNLSNIDLFEIAVKSVID